MSSALSFAARLKLRRKPNCRLRSSSSPLTLKLLFSKVLTPICTLTRIQTLTRSLRNIVLLILTWRLYPNLLILGVKGLPRAEVVTEASLESHQSELLTPIICRVIEPSTPESDFQLFRDLSDDFGTSPFLVSEFIVGSAINYSNRNPRSKLALTRTQTLILFCFSGPERIVLITLWPQEAEVAVKLEYITALERLFDKSDFPKVLIIIISWNNLQKPYSYRPRFLD